MSETWDRDEAAAFVETLFAKHQGEIYAYLLRMMRDPEMAAEVLQVIEELRAEGRDLIIVTHQLAFARRVADHVCFMAEGRIVEEAGPEIFEQATDPRTRGFFEKVLRY